LVADERPGGDPLGRRETVLAALVDAGADGVSGEVLAARLGCSRAAVHRHVDALRRSGIDVEGLHGGYRLGAGADPVIPARITPRLRPPIQGPVRWLADTGSTNDDVIAEARAGAPEGLVIGADHQAAGRGRRGRRWVSAPGDAILVSVLLRPRVAPVDAGFLPIVVAVAAADALGPDARIKWPNDVLIGDRKVVGILCEMSADQEHVAWAVAGIGVNVAATPHLEDARWRAGALNESGVRRARGDVLVDLLNALGERYSDWIADGPDAVLAEFTRRDALAGRYVEASVGREVVTGVCTGLDPLGRLVLRDGEITRTLASGEVTRVRGIPGADT